MSNIASIAPRQAKIDTTREALRQAIESETSARAVVAAHREKIARLTSIVEAAAAKLEAARAAVATERERQVQNVAAAASKGSAPLTSGALRAARMAEVDAIDELETSRAAAEKLEGSDLSGFEQEVLRAGNAICVARSALLRPVAERALAEARAAKARYVAMRELLLELFADDGAPELADFIEDLRAKEARGAPMEGVRQQARDFFLSSLTMGEDELAKSNEIRAAWRAARAALLREADAALPVLR